MIGRKLEAHRPQNSRKTPSKHILYQLLDLQLFKRIQYFLSPGTRSLAYEQRCMRSEGHEIGYEARTDTTDRRTHPLMFRRGREDLPLCQRYMQSTQLATENGDQLQPRSSNNQPLRIRPIKTPFSMIAPLTRSHACVRPLPVIPCGIFPFISSHLTRTPQLMTQYVSLHEPSSHINISSVEARLDSSGPRNTYYHPSIF